MSQIWLAAIFGAGALVALAMAGVVVWRRAAPAAVPFTLMMCAIAWWEISSALEALAMGIPAKVFWAQTEYFGIATVPTFWFWFAAAYAGKLHWLTRRVRIAFLVLPLLILLVIFTNPLHHLYWTSFTPGAGGPQDNLTYGHGTLFWVAAAYNYFLLLCGTIVFVGAVLTSRELYRLQAAAMLVAVFIPWVSNAIYIFGFGSMGGADLTPIALTLTGVIWVFSLYRFHLLDLVPVARDVVVENMSDGVIVLDARYRIVDINAAALKLLDQTSTSLIGQPAEQALTALPRWATHFEQGKHIDAVTAVPGEQERFLHIRISPLLDRRGAVSGQLFLLEDITARKRAEEQLLHANEQMRTQLEEIQSLQETLREQAIRDPLTGLYNRRMMYEMLSQELAQMTRDQRPLCVIMIDIDHFKSFNDTYGHEAGDLILKTLSDWLLGHKRRGDFVCRYGGEEFLVVLPGAKLEVGVRRAEEWRLAFRERPVQYNGRFLRTTFSLGVAASPQDGGTPEDLVRAADLALYAAKAAGRDCVKTAADAAQSLTSQHS